jgi:SAM-dependent methyltransferase
MRQITNEPTVRITRNRMGWSSEHPHEVNLAFAKFSANCKWPVLDIGAGFGAATQAALQAGACVIANDIDEDSLQAVKSRIPATFRDRLQLQPGRFPQDLKFSDESLGAIHASNVLHFLEPPDLEIGIQRLFEWLAPNGKVFVMVNSTYGENFKGYVPCFLQRKAAGEQWPGWVEDLSAYCAHPTLQFIPNQLHLFDAEVLARAFRSVGFTIELAKEFRRSYLPESLWNDGRENVILVGRK